MSLENELVRQINSLQKQVDALVKPEVGRWIDWTPVVTQSVVVAKTIVEAKYKIKESDVRIYCELNVTGAGVAGNDIVISGWPATINPSPTPLRWPLGVATIRDTGAASYQGFPVALTATTLAVIHAPVVTGQYIGTNPSFALANGDFIYLNMFWKIA